MRFQVRKIADRYEVSSLTPGTRCWWREALYPTWWQAMLHVTGQFPYGKETAWAPNLRPVFAS